MTNFFISLSNGRNRIDYTTSDVEHIPKESPISESPEDGYLSPDSLDNIATNDSSIEGPEEYLSHDTDDLD